jgi:glycogen debranching enzyme
MGSVGTIAEVSDANQLSSRGCLSQAWSLATYIELLTCLSGKEFFK